MGLAEDLARAVADLVDRLDAAQRTAALLPFDDDERRSWAYWPTDRRGLPLHALDRSQTKAVFGALGVVAPEPVLARVTTIMGLEEVLDLREGHRSDRRHRDDYWCTVFGEPGAERWAFRFEGHHVSLHATVDGGELALAPHFLGANPAAVRHDGRVVSAPLAAEEQLGFDLLHALSVEQRASAVVADTAPDDIVSRNAAHLDGVLGAGEGVPLTALAGDAREAADALVTLYLDRFPAGARRPDPDGARFAWAGADAPGTGHYYRLSGPRLLVELDNTQDGANHVHTVVRDPAGDFGDPLAAHHRDDHATGSGTSVG